MWVNNIMKPSVFDVIVVGGGHAGVEAALAAKRVGVSVALITMNPQTIGRMSCNPSIGGLAKGQMVREIDALGGVMGLAADSTGTQYKLLNKSKGRAVWSPRAQVDKREYEKFIKRYLQKKNVTTIEGEAVSPAVNGGAVIGVNMSNNDQLLCKKLILTNGTFLNGLLHIGDKKIPAGRMGEVRSEGITEALNALGLKSGRLKTGTPPRLYKNSINWEHLQSIDGDALPIPFSHFHTSFTPTNEPSFAVSTNPLVHQAVWENINLSPMYSGDILGVGPRYCPSIEDKINRFKGRDSHRLICEPEWKNSDQIYLNGFSTSLPESVQLKALRQIMGFNNVELVKPGYAIEYDYFYPNQLKRTLETKNITGLYLAGQINGTSGYEEAAIQGLIAGANAALSAKNHKPLVLSRSEAYGGVLVDDLTTKSTPEPYRMFTSRAENRLVLRFTNASTRLAEKAFNSKLIDNKQYDIMKKQQEEVCKIKEACKQPITPPVANPVLAQLNEPEIKQQIKLKELIKRPGVMISMFIPMLLQKPQVQEPYVYETSLEADTEIKYKGYIKRIDKQTKDILKNDSLALDPKTNYKDVEGLSSEAQEKLDLTKPETLGQAMRVSGVSISDVAVLNIYTAKKMRVSRETNR